MRCRRQDDVVRARICDAAWPSRKGAVVLPEWELTTDCGAAMTSPWACLGVSIALIPSELDADPLSLEIRVEPVPDPTNAVAPQQRLEDCGSYLHAYDTVTWVACARCRGSGGDDGESWHVLPAHTACVSGHRANVASGGGALSVRIAGAIIAHASAFGRRTGDVVCHVGSTVISRPPQSANVAGF